MIYEATLIGPLAQVVSLIGYIISTCVAQGHNVSGETFVTAPDVPIALTPSHWLLGLLGIDMTLLVFSSVYQLNNQLVLPKRFQRVLFHTTLALSNSLFTVHNILLVNGANTVAMLCCLLSGVSGMLCYSTYHLSRRFRGLDEKAREQGLRINFRVFRFVVMDLPVSVHATVLLFISFVSPVQSMNMDVASQVIAELGFLFFVSLGFFGLKDSVCICTATLLILTQVTKIFSNIDIETPWTVPEYSVLTCFILSCLLTVSGATFDVVSFLKSAKKQHAGEKGDVEKRMRPHPKSKSHSRRSAKAGSRRSGERGQEQSLPGEQDETLSCDLENWKRESVCEVPKITQSDMCILSPSRE